MTVGQKLYPHVARFLLRPIRRLTNRITRFSDELRYYCGLWFAYAPREDDVFIVSYPKAGATVLQMMLYQMTGDGDMEKIPHIDTVTPWFENALSLGPAYLEGIRSPRVFKTHRTLAHIPPQVRSIYIVRNVKDSCVSYFHHLTSLNSVSVSVGEFVNLFLKGDVPWGSWAQHLQRSMKVLHGRVLFLCYEDLCSNLPQTVDKVAAFCGIRFNEQKRAQIIERCSIDFMKKHNLKFDPRFVTKRSDRTEFIRRGAVGDWSNLLTPRLALRLDKYADQASAAITRRFPGTDLSFLHSPLQSVVRGTLSVRFHAERGDRFWSRQGDRPAGVFIATKNHNGELSPGDKVRLILELRGRDSITVSIALFGGPQSEKSEAGMMFTFISLAPEEQRSLKMFVEETNASPESLKDGSTATSHQYGGGVMESTTART